MTTCSLCASAVACMHYSVHVQYTVYVPSDVRLQFNNVASIEFPSFISRLMAEAVGRRLLSWGGSGTFPNRYCKVCDGQRIVVLVLSPSTSLLPSQCHFTMATDPPPFTRYGRSLGTFKESSLIAEIREHWLKN